MRNSLFIVVAGIVSLILISGCTTTASSRAVQTDNQAWEGSVLITQEGLSDGISFQVIGSVEARARAGYSSVESLYPLLADEARKLGANAVINTRGSRRVTAFSWSAPYVSGTAVKAEDEQKLGNVVGTHH